MELQEIEVDIDRLGNVQLKLHGFSGTRCLDATASLEDALGTVEEREMRPEALDHPLALDQHRFVGGDGSSEAPAW